MIIFEHHILGLPLSVSFVVFKFVQEGVWDQDLEKDLTSNDLPVSSSSEVIILGDQFFNKHPLEVNHVSKHQRQYVDKIESECHPHQYGDCSHILMVQWQVILHIVVVFFIGNE